MKPGELERSLARLGQEATAARQRLNELCVEIERIRATMDKLVASGKTTDRSEDRQMAANRTSEVERVQVEAVLK